MENDSLRWRDALGIRPNEPSPSRGVPEPTPEPAAPPSFSERVTLARSAFADVSQSRMSEAEHDQLARDLYNLSILLAGPHEEGSSAKHSIRSSGT